MTLEEVAMRNFGATLFECPLAEPCARCPYFVYVVSQRTSCVSHMTNRVCVFGDLIQFTSLVRTYHPMTTRQDLRARRRGA